MCHTRRGFARSPLAPLPRLPAGAKHSPLRPDNLPKPDFPLGAVCCGGLPDGSAAKCATCKGGKCSHRGKVGHLPHVERCGAVLSAAACASLSVSPGGSAKSIKYAYRHSCCKDKQIKASADGLTFMLAPLSELVRAAFLASAKTYYDAKVEIAAKKAGSAGGADSWVQCEAQTCAKWRKVPQGIDAQALADGWTCAASTWSAGIASCDEPEELL